MDFVTWLLLLLQQISLGRTESIILSPGRFHVSFLQCTSSGHYSLWRKDRSSSRRNCSVSCILVTAADRPVCHGCQWHALSCIVKGEDSNRHRPFKAAWVCMTCMSQQCFKRRPRPIGIQALLHNQSLIGPSAVRCSLGSVHQVS